MIDNLKQHGTVFNLNDDQSFIDDLLNIDLKLDNEIKEAPSDETFEEEN